MIKRITTFLAVLSALLGITSVAIAAPQPLDGKLVDVARKTPSFGGMFERNGMLHVYLTDPGSAARADAARTLRRNSFRVLKARYAFDQLERWQQRLNASLLGLPGVVFTDVDDAKNRLAVGIEKQGLRSLVRVRITSLGIPREAVRIHRTAPVGRLSSLNDFHRPLVGGLQINFNFPVGQAFCTLGFNAVRRGVSGYVTNSHCTTVQGGVEGTIHYQPDQSSPANRVGVETVDPVYFRGGLCRFSTRRCRFSDSAFVKRDSGVSASLGRIAKGDPSLTTWNGDVYRITSKSDPIVGQFVEKVGRTTGRTGAPVVRTCFDILVNNTNILLLCQAQANLFALGGDSGSPVFTPSGSDAKLRGLLWGGGSLTGESFFSPISSVQRSTELGPLSVCASGFSC